MKASFLFFALTTLLLATSCASKLTPFTKSMQDDFGWQSEDLQRIQFYLSKDIELRRQLTAGSSEIVSGKIRIENGREVEVITIPQGTPGVFLFSPKADRFAVSFEDGPEDQYLMFGPNPKVSNRFVLLASDWERNSGKVRYAGKSYRVSSDDAYAGLLVDLRKITKTQRQSRVAQGRKVNR